MSDNTSVEPMLLNCSFRLLPTHYVLNTSLLNPHLFYFEARARFQLAVNIVRMYFYMYQHLLFFIFAMNILHKPMFFLYSRCIRCISLPRLYTCVHICVYVCVCIYMCIYIYMCIHLMFVEQLN